MFANLVSKGLVKPLKVKQGPYVSLEPLQVALACESACDSILTGMCNKLEKFYVKIIKNHRDDQGQTGFGWANDCIGLCAHMSHIGSVWASASVAPTAREQELDTLKALAMGSERHIVMRNKKLYVIELQDILKDTSFNEFVHAVMAHTRKSHEYYESRGYESCPYVLDELDLLFSFER